MQPKLTSWQVKNYKKNSSNDTDALLFFVIWQFFCFVFAGLDAAKADELASYKGWWAQFMKDPEDDKELLNVELGNKMVLLMDILKESYLIGDKVLVFSQSLLSLDLIEKFLSVAAYDDTFGTWNHG